MKSSNAALGTLGRDGVFRAQHELSAPITVKTWPNESNA